MISSEAASDVKDEVGSTLWEVSADAASVEAFRWATG